jgi:hypothetical protein
LPLQVNDFRRFWSETITLGSESITPIMPQLIEKVQTPSVGNYHTSNPLIDRVLNSPARSSGLRCGCWLAAAPQAPHGGDFIVEA